jgi:hypothetical protein
MKIPNLIHHMRLSTNYVSSMMLRPNELEIPNVMTVKTRKTPKQNIP